MEKRFGNYILLKRLAVGGMGEIFLAKESKGSNIERYVVIKKIISGFTEDEKFVNMFLDEARIAMLLTHPNIVQIYDFGSVEDNFYLSMEFLEGRDLRRILKKLGENKPLEYKYAVHIAHSICSALHYAHTKTDSQGSPLNIIHRDISPQNIFITFDGVVKLLDFGIAKARIRTSKTQTGVLKGKYSYMSPEQVKGEPIDPQADIFSLGIVLYEMTTGKRLFKRKNELQTLKAVVSEPILPPTSIIPDYPEKLSAIVMKALERDKKKRYSSCLEMQEALEEFMESTGIIPSPKKLGDFLKELFHDEPKNLKEILEEQKKQTTYITYREEEEIGELEEVVDEVLSLNISQASSQSSPSSSEIVREIPREEVLKNIKDELQPLPNEPATITDSSSPSIRGTTETSFRTFFSIISNIKSHPIITGGVATFIFIIVPMIIVLSVYLLNLRENIRSNELKVKETKETIKPVSTPLLNVSSTPNTSLDSKSNSTTLLEGKEEKTYSYLTLKVDPPSKIYINSEYKGYKKVENIKLEPGKYNLKFYNTKPKLEYYTTITVEPGKNIYKNFIINKGALFITVNPYAEVFIDGKSYGYTPMPPIQLYPATYTIKLYNEELKAVLQKNIKIEEDQTLTIRHRF